MTYKFYKTSIFQIIIILLCATSSLLSQEKTIVLVNDSLELQANIIYEDGFDRDLRWWEIEQQPGGSAEIKNGKLEIVDAKGCTVWFKHQLNQPVMIEYTATVIDEGGPHDRVSDLNCFWLASDPEPREIFTETNRVGIFRQYDTLHLYYVGLGGHHNTKTRFRKYKGDGTKPLLPEHDHSDPKYLIKPNKVNRIKIIAFNGIIQYWRNDQLIFNIYDENPYPSGFFAFRTVNNHLTIDDFKVYSLQKKNNLKTANPMVYNVGMADPHIRIYNNKAYLYATRDAHRYVKKFTMPDWHIWSSSDLIHWKLEHSIYPTETYMGNSDRCWAPDVGYRDGKYYFYFSNGNTDTGVMEGDSPIGPFKDALGEPMLPVDLTPIKEYDPTILEDDDGAQYIVFGHHRITDPAYFFAIARLNEDMITLAEEPKEIIFQGESEFLKGNDKPNLHKYRGNYYLSAGSHYAMSNNVYGPYTRIGNSGNDKNGLNGRAHGNYFEWNNQWFHTWCHFHLGKDVARYRESYITYLHYRENGEMVDDVDYLNNHFDFGVGQYDAKWEKIESEWYMQAKGVEKEEGKDGGFQVSSVWNGGFIYFPNVYDLSNRSQLVLSLKGDQGTAVEIRTEGIHGPLLGRIELLEDIFTFEPIQIQIENQDEAKNLYFIFKNEENQSISMDWFKFQFE